MSLYPGLDLNSGIVEGIVRTCVHDFPEVGARTVAVSIFKQLRTWYDWLGVVSVEEIDGTLRVCLITEYGCRSFAFSVNL